MLGIFMEASSWRHDQLLAFWELRAGAENSKFLIVGWSFWWPAPIRSTPRVASVGQKMPPLLLPLRNLPWFQSPVQWGQRPTPRMRDSPSARFLELCVRKSGQRLIHVFFTISHECYRILPEIFFLVVPVSLIPCRIEGFHFLGEFLSCWLSALFFIVLT